jgi:phage terminase large subunit GpA-like protein
VPFQLAVHGRTHKRVVFVVSAQSGKTESVFDIIGERLDSAPVPMIFVGPSKQMLTEQLEPRLDELLRNTALKNSMAPDYLQKKTRKFVNGVPLRLAHGGSSTALKSDPAGLVVTDEADELMANVRGAGNPILLADARGDTHADFVHAVTSTPSEGIADIVRDPVSGLEFWDAPDSEEDLKAQVQSTIWRLWLSGTRHHWAWPCPHCGEYFIPRFECLQWEKQVGPDGRERPSTPSLALETAYLQCPQGCADPILEEHKEEMNARGVYVAPGQSIEPDGTVIGPTPKSWTLSFWVSGLCSPFVSFGERAARYVEAVRSGDPESIKAVKNQGFGELYSPPSGSVPEWSHLMSLRLPYARGDVPKGVLFLTAGVDVQGDRLVYVVRGWGYRQESWLIDHGEIWGDTQYDDVWFELADYLSQEFGGMHIRRAFIDSGFRPGKKITVPVHMVYEFCHRYRRVAYPTKGQDRRRTPLAVTRIDVTPGGGKPEYGVDLVLLDTDFLKCFVHQRLTWPAGQPGGWHLHQDVDEGYCRQIVSEARVKKPKGDGFKWQPKSKQNHFLDAESLAYAAAYMLGVQRLVSRNDERPQKGAAPDGGDEAADQQATAAPTAQAAPKTVPAGPRQVFGKQSAAASLARLNRPRGETS